jgi:hypothetical protein
MELGTGSTIAGHENKQKLPLIKVVAMSLIDAVDGSSTGT